MTAERTEVAASSTTPTAGASAVVGDWKTIKRGAAWRWTFRGRPVYTYVKDEPGEARGDGIEYAKKDGDRRASRLANGYCCRLEWFR